MKIVGCDLHAKQQSIAMVDTETGEFTEKTLSHEGHELREFYAALEGRVVVGIEATGAMQWFLELLEELGIECRVGHPAWDCHLVGHSAEDLRGMYPQSALALEECISHERQAVVPTIPATIGTVFLDADACGLVLLSLPPSLMRMLMSVMACGC